MSEKIGCHNCVGACCRKGTSMVLNESERVTLEEAGTELSDITPQSIRALLDAGTDGIYDPTTKTLICAGDGEYLLTSDCGWLIEDAGTFPKCGLYGDERKPQVCTSFKEGGPACTTVRIRRGVDNNPENILFLST